MGIDVYMSWDNQTEDEQKARYTGFSVTSGNVGYLREAYHGGPYATHTLLPEAFDERKLDEHYRENPDDRDWEGFEFPAELLRSRLDVTVLAALTREILVYEQRSNPGVFEGEFDDDMRRKIIDIVKNEVKNLGVKPDQIPKKAMEAFLEWKIDGKELPAVAKAYEDFVKLAETKERETGRPVRIYASY